MQAIMSVAWFDGLFLSNNVIRVPNVEHVSLELGCKGSLDVPLIWVCTIQHHLARDTECTR